MTQQYDITQRVLTDDEIMQSAISACDSLNITRFHEIGAPSKTIMDDAGLLELGRALEGAVLSKLRAPVASIREGFELTYAADADDPACATDLFHFTNGWRACVMFQVRAPVVDERAAFSRAEVSFPLTIPENRVYLAGPMTGYEDHNFPAFHAAAERLRGSGLEVVNPADHGLVSGLGWSDYMRWDLVKLAGCHAVYVLPGWEKSKGASLEISIARALGMPVFTVDGAPLASAPVTDLRPHLEWALRRIRTSLDTGDKFEAAQAALNAARAGAPASASVPEPFDPEVLAERLRDVAASHYETALGFGISRDNFERCATDAAKIARDMASAPVAGEAQGWSGWACQYQNKLPRLYGSKEIAQLNCDAANGDRVLFLSEHAAPQASALDAEYSRGRADGFDAGHSAALEKAAAAVEDHQRAGRGWIPGSLWDTLSREAAARIRALKQPQASAEDALMAPADVAQLVAFIFDRFGQPFDAEALAERLRDVAASHYETALGFGISRDNFERCATDAAKIARDMASAPVAGEAQGWSGWACQYQNKLPRLYGSKEIAQLNCDAANGDRVLFLSEHAAPQASAEGVRNAALEEAAQVAYEELHPKNPRSDWTEYAEHSAQHAAWAARSIRALKQPQADKDGGQQRAGDGKEPR